jgi:hypothetical protein
MPKVSGDIYEGVIPGQSSGAIVNISVWAIDDSSLVSVSNLDDNGEPVRYVYPVKSHSASLKIAPKAYNIYAGVPVEIGYYANEGDIAVIRIYNAEGKLIATPRHKVVNNTDKDNVNDSVFFFNWDGKDKDFKLVPPGLYICHLEVTDKLTGNKKNDKAPIVIGTRLK